MTTCRVPGCVKARRSRGLCGAHYNRWWRTGSTHSDKPLRSRNRAEPERATPILIAHPVAAKRAANGLPPASRHERLAALAKLAEQPGLTLERYEAEKARILSQEEA